MSTEDDTFVALGRANVGFRTSGTHIDTGADVTGTTVGVVGTGPTGVHGFGTDTAVIGEGVDDGRGGVFSSHLFAAAQLRLRPQAVATSLATSQQEGTLISNPATVLPVAGDVGDLLAISLLDSEPAVTCSLFLCVQAQDVNEPARWVQIMVGPDHAGTRIPPPQL